MTVTFKLNSDAIRKLLTSREAQKELNHRGKLLATSANTIPSTTEPEATEPYYEAVEAPDANRARTYVRTTGARAARHEAKTQALLEAFSRGH